MSLSIIIRKKDVFQSPVRLSVQKLNKYAWRKYMNRRKRSFGQKMRSFFKGAFAKKNVYRIEGQVAMF